jgi:N-acetylglucosamine-6-phosphate deacetylase
MFAAKKSIVGKISDGSAVLQIEFDRAVTSVDELVQPPDVDHFLAPGFIDLQVNGFAGVDYNDPAITHEAIARSIGTMFETGVTRFLATLITGPEQRIVAALRKLSAAKAEFQSARMPEGDAMEAFHIEGPHISPEDGPRGAHPREHVRPPDIEEFKRWQEAAEGNIRLITLSPEWPEAPAYIATLVRSGVVASIGHTKASSEQIQAATAAGATLSTHLGNAAHTTLHKTQNYLWDQLAEDRLAASYIVDGIHLPAAFLRTALRAKGVERSVLVTDAVMPAMCPPGPYKLGQLDVELRYNGSVVLLGGDRLAGSALRMDHAIGNVVHIAGVSLREALAMATVNAARVGRLAGRQRGLTPGEKADLVRFHWDARADVLRVEETIVAGTSVYRA